MKPLKSKGPWVIEIDRWHPKRLNQLLGAHWAKRNRMKMNDYTMIWGYSRTIPNATGKRRVQITIVLGPKQRGGDPDAYQKVTLDALVACHLLKDDNRQWLDLQPVQFERAAEFGTRIEIEDC